MHATELFLPRIDTDEHGYSKRCSVSRLPMPRRNALSAFIRGIRGEKPRSPGSRPRSDRSWRCRRAGFDRVEKHAGDIQPELRIQLADARRAGDVALGAVVADHVQAHEATTEPAHPR